MKYYSIPLTLALTACGTPSSSPSDPTSQECKGNRIWDETQGECIKPIQDASLEDAIAQDSGYIQKYEGKLYGYYQNDDTHGIFITFDFQTGKFERLLSNNGEIVSLPPNATSIASASLSPGNTYLLSSLSFNNNESKKMYLFNLNDGTSTYLAPLIGTAQFAWRDDNTYFVSLAEQIEETQEYDFARRVYKHQMGNNNPSDWIVQDLGKSEMPIASSSDNNIAILCLASGANPADSYHAEKEICATGTSPADIHTFFTKESEGLRNGISFAHSMRLYWPEQQLSKVYTPCAKDGIENYLCSFDLFSRTEPKIVAQGDRERLGTATFNPTTQYVILDEDTMFNLQNNIKEGSFLPPTINFEGRQLYDTQNIQWIVWRED